MENQLLNDRAVVDCLRAAMNRERMNQTGLANRLNISPAFVSLVLSGKKPPTGPILDYLGLQREETARKVQRTYSKIPPRRQRARA